MKNNQNNITKFFALILTLSLCLSGVTFAETAPLLDPTVTNPVIDPLNPSLTASAEELLADTSTDFLAETTTLSAAASTESHYGNSLASEDLIEGASACFMFMGDPRQVSGGCSGDELHFSGGAFSQVGFALVQDGINISGKKLKFNYRASGDIYKVTLEFKEWVDGQLVVRHSMPNISLPRSLGKEVGTEFELPTSADLENIDEVVFVYRDFPFYGSLSMTITDLDIVPNGFQDLIYENNGSFSWGDNIMAYATEDAYVIQSPSFTSSGTAFLLGDADLSGGQLVLQYSSTTDVGTGKLELKQRTADGQLLIRSVIENIAFENTGGEIREIRVDLPENANFTGMDEAVLLIEGGTGNAMDLTITQLGVIQRDPLDVLHGSANVFTWGNYNTMAFFDGSKYVITAQPLISLGTAFVQNNPITATGQRLRLVYESAYEDIGNVRFEFKKTVNGVLETVYQTEDVFLNATGQGRELEVNIDLPSIAALMGIEEIIMSIPTGLGRDILFNISSLDVLPPLAQHNVIADAANSFAWGDDNTSYTAYIQNDIDIESESFLKLTYKSNTDVGDVTFEFKTTDAGTQTLYETDPVYIGDTHNVEQVLYIPLSDIDLLGIDEIIMILTGGSLNFVALDLEIV